MAEFSCKHVSCLSTTLNIELWTYYHQLSHVFPLLWKCPAVKFKSQFSTVYHHLFSKLYKVPLFFINFIIMLNLDFLNFVHYQLLIVGFLHFFIMHPKLKKKKLPYKLFIKIIKLASGSWSNFKLKSKF